jgi:exodeoxyribonuclease VII small subunit
MAKTESKSIEDLSYEQAFAELETIVAALEAGDRALEESLALFERGQALTRRCAELLEKAEMKVRTLSGETMTELEEEQ